MPNQRDIAEAAGVTQAAVSMALRGDPSIPECTRQRIREIAEKLGYRPNAYVSTLMAHIRSGRPPRDKGCIAVIVDGLSEKDWLRGETPRLQYRGIAQRALALGFHTECFYLGDTDPTMSKINRILQARGINGVILAAPRKLARTRIDMDWSRYAVATIAYSWTPPLVDRVASHHRHSVDVAFGQLAKRGYQRIGMCLPPDAVEGVDSNWLAGWYIARHRMRPSRRIPLFAGRPDITPFTRFRAWFQKWKPDALLCIMGHETEWLDQLGLSAPRDIGLVCINRPLGSHFSGLEERHETIGAATLDLVAARIRNNEYGLPEEPKLILIDGRWHDGETLRPAPAGEVL
ncbi:LacI family transcriptional regulator [Opitutaceae bacterium TAV5]|nr:LacI family transcriptional regulator [Opitutaceae bacterium TAV5]